MVDAKLLSEPSSESSADSQPSKERRNAVRCYRSTAANAPTLFIGIQPLSLGTVMAVTIAAPFSQRFDGICIFSQHLALVTWTMMAVTICGSVRSHRGWVAFSQHLIICHLDIDGRDGCGYVPTEGGGQVSSGFGYGANDDGVR